MFDAIAKMTGEFVRITGGKLYGVWLYGSVVLDDFHPGWSDIDLIALTDGPLTAEQAAALLMLRQEMQAREPGNPYYRLCEGITADRDEYRRRSFTRLVYWGTSGQRITDRHARDVFAEYELARYGRAVYGGHPWPLPPPGGDELTEAVRRHYDAIRKYAVRTGGSLYSCGWLLDIARCIRTLRFRDVIAKTQAGLWALEEHLFPDEEPLKRAVELRLHPERAGDAACIDWLESLGPVVQRYADVLERELQAR